MYHQISQTMIEGIMLVFRCFEYPSNQFSDGTPNLVNHDMIEFCGVKIYRESLVPLITHSVIGKWNQ